MAALLKDADPRTLPDDHSHFTVDSFVSEFVLFVWKPPQHIANTAKETERAKNQHQERLGVQPVIK
jgi:hypothetical protein